MHISIGLENGIEGRSLAWALDYPGCFAYGSDSSTAIVSMGAAFVMYKGWVARHTRESWLDKIQEFDIRLSEVWEVYHLDENYNTLPEGGYEINAWFRHDWKPLTRIELRQGLQLLQWSREDLLALAQPLTDAQLDREYPGERWTIRGILNHVGGAEWWYLDRLGLVDLKRNELPKDPFERLPLLREYLVAGLKKTEGEELVRGKDAEFWSPRKLLRRAIWHELDHIEHIQKLLAQVG